MLSGLIKGLADIVYPKLCSACRSRLKDNRSIDNYICLECWAKIKRNMPPFCHHCGRHLETHRYAKNICPQCVRRQLHFDRAFSPCVYDGVVKELIHAFKYKNKDYLGKPLSKLMIEFIKEYSLPMDFIDMIIPVPLHKVKLREREFNQALILSEYLGEEFAKPIAPDTLIRHRYTRTQTELEDNERIVNVRDSFSIKKAQNLEGKNVLLVDDVLTTGATSSEASLALKKSGAKIVFVLTLSN